MEQIPLKKLMTKEVKCVSPKTKLKEVTRLMDGHHFSCLVVTEDNAPIGIITERDMIRVLGYKLRNQSSPTPDTAGFMSSPVTTINESATFLEAIAVTRVRKIRHLPVVNNRGKLAGLVTQSDLVQAYHLIIEAQQAAIERSITERTKELTERAKELQDANAQLNALSLEDPLLCIGNRRAMEIDLAHRHSEVSRYHGIYSVILLDIDHFKQYNDFYGHSAGDNILKQVTDYIKGSIRKSDRLYRYGGEEFLLVLPETPLENATGLANRLVKGLSRLGIPHEKSPCKIVTMTGGIGYKDIKETGKTSWKDVVKHADRGLYRGKENGRNQVAIEQSETTKS